MRVLVVGDDARAHALAWRLSRSPSVAEVVTCPGNMGTATLGDRWASVDPSRGDELALACHRAGINLAVFGDEHPLLIGVADKLRHYGVPVFGPSHAAAGIELKRRGKEAMWQAQIPTAPWAVCYSADEALSQVSQILKITHHSEDVVIKPLSALMPKHFLTLARSRAEAEDAIRRIFAHEHGREGLLVEKCLYGREISIHALCDGERIAMCPVTQDHKRAGRGDQGPMTGGMGAVTRHDLAGLLPEIEARIIAPMARYLRGNHTPFQGVLYPGVMLTEDGPQVIEWNVRFGNPEAQALLSILDGDLGGICWASATGGLDPSMVRWKTSHAAAVCVATEGYPEEKKPSGSIVIVDNAASEGRSWIFHGGTFVRDGQLQSRGGRAFTAVSTKENLPLAMLAANQAADRVRFRGAWYRDDIGQGALREMAEAEA